MISIHNLRLMRKRRVTDHLASQMRRAGEYRRTTTMMKTMSRLQHLLRNVGMKTMKTMPRLKTSRMSMAQPTMMTKKTKTTTRMKLW